MTAEASPADSPETKPRSRIRTWLILAGVLVIVVGGAIIGYTYLRNTGLYVTTDDALVHSNMAPIAATGAGTLETWLTEPGAQVVADQTIGFVRPALSGAAADSFKITAPVSGTVIRVDAKVGQIVSPFQPLAYVANLDGLTIRAYIDETQIHRIKAGQPVDVTVDATGSRTYKGTVKRIMPATASEFSLLPASDRTTANFTRVIQRIIVDVDLGNTSGLGLYPGMSAYVRIHAPSSGP
ncbi:MAG: HlyD family efflux transporter periplasmic adaptor subunit [Anaerolineae bacterium]